MVTGNRVVPNIAAAPGSSTKTQNLSGMHCIASRLLFQRERCPVGSGHAELNMANVSSLTVHPSALLQAAAPPAPVDNGFPVEEALFVAEEAQVSSTS